MIGKEFQRNWLAIWLTVCALVVVSCQRQNPKQSAKWGQPEVENASPSVTLPSVGKTEIRKPAGPPTMATGTFDEKGRPVAVACATCHVGKEANANAKVGTPLAQFHQSLAGAHGNLTCISCHNPNDGYATLRLADGSSVGYSEVMTLCAQCHGPQYRDYLHGAHGGMIGYWDLKKGGRVRNNCIDCHQPHAPKYPTVAPAPGPRDGAPTGGNAHE